VHTRRYLDAETSVHSAVVAQAAMSGFSSGHAWRIVSRSYPMAGFRNWSARSGTHDSKPAESMRTGEQWMKSAEGCDEKKLLSSVRCCLFAASRWETLVVAEMNSERKLDFQWFERKAAYPVAISNQMMGTHLRLADLYRRRLEHSSLQVAARCTLLLVARIQVAMALRVML